MTEGYDIDVELRAGSVLLSSAGLDDIPSFRAVWERLSVDTALSTSEAVDVEDLVIPDALGLRIYRPAVAGGRSPAVVMLHSGGFVGGSIETIHREALDLAEGLGAVVVSVAYRLAPEHPYPAALDDCVSALRWVVENSAQLRVDPARIALHGTSAGGGLAAATALRLLESGEPQVAFVYLNAPQLDDRLQTGSMREYTDTPCFTLNAAEISWDSYLGPGVRGTEAVSVYAAPARSSTDDLRGFPPTYVAAMQFDPLRDEAIGFAQRLLSAGVPVELHVFPQTFHGSSVIDHAEVSRRETSEALAVLKGRLRASSW